MYPPTSRDLVKEFAARAVEPGRHVHEHSGAARTRCKRQERTASSPICGPPSARTTSSIISLLSTRTNETDPTTFILNRLQRDASGKIKLGLDLQGGTAFLVEMDTNALAASVANGDTNAVVSQSDTAGAISQAVEVLRKRVDQFGVAEPVIQPEGANQILIQLPGLSEADKESAAANIRKKPRFWNSGW